MDRIELEGWPIAHAAAMTGVSLQTATKQVAAIPMAVLVNASP